jgi:serine/threonine-protein kinase
MPCLFRVLAGPYRGKVFPLETARPLLVGKALEADFTIPDGALEPFHAKIEFDEGRAGHMARVSSLDPEKASIEFDGVPMDEALVKSGDRFKIGETTLEFREGGRPGDPLSGRQAAAGTRCAACGRPVPRLGGGRMLLGAAYCVRCIDLRLTIRRDLGRYRVLRKMARDVAEITYVAEDLSKTPPERVALRVLKSERQNDPRVVRRFLVKAVFAYGLDHPVFARTRDLSQRPGTIEYVEDLCEWPTLEERLLAGATFPVHAAVKICLQIVEALRYARRRGMVIGKLRAARLQISNDGSVRIRDYWLAPAVEEEVAAGIGAPRLDPQPIEKGSVDESGDLKRYLAPDDRDAAHFHDEALDVRPVGIVLFQLATGTHPGDATTQELAERMKKAFLKKRRTTSPPSLPAIAQKVIARTLDRNPANRYRSLEELGRDLKAAFMAL